MDSSRICVCSEKVRLFFGRVLWNGLNGKINIEFSCVYLRLCASPSFFQFITLAAKNQSVDRLVVDGVNFVFLLLSGGRSR